MKFYSLFFMIVSTLSVHLSFSQSKIRLQHFSTRDDLSQNTINFIFQDSKGFIWIGTHDGLNFTVFNTNEEDPNSINSNDNYSDFEDSKGEGYGLEQVRAFHCTTGNWIISKNVNMYTKGDIFLRPIWDIVASHDLNQLWLGASGGLFLFDMEKESFKHYVIDEVA